MALYGLKDALFLASEKTAIEASAHVETETGSPVSVHPGRHHESPWEIVRIYQEAGGRTDRLVMSHVDSE